jgi:hypothetical protein
MVEAELAWDSEIVNRVAHFGHFIRLPALVAGGRLRMTPQFWHWMVRGIFMPNSGFFHR